jgi:hypothetical protein
MKNQISPSQISQSWQKSCRACLSSYVLNSYKGLLKLRITMHLVAQTASNKDDAISSKKVANSVVDRHKYCAQSY